MNSNTESQEPGSTAILVTGNCGWIGSTIARQLIKKGYKVIGIDNLSTGRANNSPRECTTHIGDVTDAKFLDSVFKRYMIAGVIHCAGVLSVEESIDNPQKYWFNNVEGTRTLVSACQKHGVDNIVFSSTAAVYGNVQSLVPVDEACLVRPINPYGESKLIAEETIRHSGKNYCILRYFNVAGSGQNNDSKNLIKMACMASLFDKPLEVFGSKFPTYDGTAIRDYIHVEDLAAAHVLAIGAMLSAKALMRTYNVGYGNGYSVLEVLKAVCKVSNKSKRFQIVKPRAGDPACVIADSSLIKQELGWEPKFNNLSHIIHESYVWFAKKYGVEPSSLEGPPTSWRIIA